ncbi:unnamed protein product [Porites evermanni]|uniref:Uncharacterized protein n=1 Tax=Porites evermanni TaxID=104178 RepID=A0ABN8QMD0_9CNID|nr:unnamed protein product [Porites evermanni]
MKVHFVLLIVRWFGHFGTLAASGCGLVVNKTLKSPGYPSHYPSNTHCVYSVSIPEGMALKIVFLDFWLQDPLIPRMMSLCFYDYLKVANENNVEVGRFCGELTGEEAVVGGIFPNITAPVPGTIIRTPAGVTKLKCTSTGTPSIYTAIIFNGSVQQNTTRSAELSLNEGGNYSCVATSYYGTNIRVIPVVIIGCGSVFNNTLKSPDYPNDYPSNMHCVYKIVIPGGMALKITYQDFLLDYDYLKVTDDENNYVTHDCGQSTGKEIFVGGKEALITFHSDGDYQNRGFMLLFTFIHPTLPKIILPDPAFTVRAFKDARLSVTTTGTPPIVLSFMKNSTVLGRAVSTGKFKLSAQGNYSCVAVNNYGNYTRTDFSVVFIDCRQECTMSVIPENSISCQNVTSSVSDFIEECAPTITDIL